jgi:hypothetical protein
MHGVERDQVIDAKPRRGGARMVSLVVGAAVSLGLVTATLSAPAQAEASGPTVAQALTLSSAAATPITAANANLATAVRQVDQRQIAAAITTLVSLQSNVTKANNNAMALIGKPPTDPESDDPPGPPAVIAALALDHRVTMGIVPLFNGRKRSDIVQELRDTLWVTHTLRQQMLNRVTGLAPEGAGADYSDDMSDTLGLYSAEVTLVTKALQTYQLTPSGRLGLARALARVKLAKATMDKAYGGGE